MSWSKILFASVIIGIAHFAVAADVPWDNPFGVVNSWPGIGEIGLGWCRCGSISPVCNWRNIQKDPDSFSWEESDRDYEAIRRENLVPVPLLCYTAPWAGSDPEDPAHSSPKNLRDYFRFIRKTVEHYRGRIPAYEAWNEPNGRAGFFRGGCDQLVEIVKTAWCAVKQADPQAKLIFPGLAGVDIPFLERCYELGAGDYFDIMAVHPYQYTNQFNEHYTSIKRLPILRDTMDRFGDSVKPIWLNEFGWAPARNKCSLEEQASLLTIGMAYYRSLEYLGIERLFWYYAKVQGSDYGLFDASGKKRPAFFAYKKVVENLRGKHYFGEIPLPNAKVLIFSEDDPAKPVTLVAWSAEPTAVSVAIPLKTGPRKVDLTMAPTFLTVPRAELKDVKRGPKVLPRPGKIVAKDRELFVWSQIVVPPTTHRAYLNPGDNTLKVKVWNMSDQVRRGSINLSSPELAIAGSRNYSLEPHTSTILDFPVRVARDTKPGLYRIRVGGTAETKKLSEFQDVVRVGSGAVIEFLGNSWIESLYIKEAGRGSASTTFGDQFTYQFDLSDARQAKFTLRVGSPSKKPWYVEVSSDGKSFEQVLSGKSWPKDHVFDMPEKFLGKKVILRLKGSPCQLTYLVLETARPGDKCDDD